MNFYRLSVYAAMCSAVACGKPEAELVVPTGTPETVVIGCAGVGADIEVRTQLGEDLSLRWVSGDEIRLWAREHGDAAFLPAVQNIPFRFDYYSPTWSRAGFTGTITGVDSQFETGKSYDYYAVSPAPASDEDIAGTRVTYTIPEVQDGSFDGSCDLLTARLEKAPALQKGDNNPAIALQFRHHLHAMQFTVPQNALGEPISAVELIFPRPVAGRMTVDMTGATPDDFSELDRQTLTIDFPKGEERDAGDTFYAMVAPTAFGIGEQIGMRIIGTTGETSADYTFTQPTSFSAEGLTRVELHVPAKNTDYTVVRFNVADNDRAEFAGEPNRFGENTLGERVQFVRLKGEEGAFANAVRMSNGCSVSEDGSVLTCEIAPDQTDGEYELMFVSRKLAGSRCPWEKWDGSLISGRQVEVEFESENAHIRSIAGFSSVQVPVPTIQDGGINTLPVLSVPYFFEEDFGKANGLDINGTNNTKEDKGSDLDSQYFVYGGWTGNQIAGSTNYIEIKTRVEATLIASGLYNGRLDSAPMQYWKDDNSGRKKLQVRFDYYHRAGSSKNYTRTMNYGTTETAGPIAAYYYNLSSHGDHVSGNSQSLSVDVGGAISDWTIENATNATRLSWELEVTGKPETGSYNHFLRLSNLKVSIVSE